MNTNCSKYLFERFQYLFEPELIELVCQFGKLKEVKANETLMDIGQSIDHMPLILKGSIKVMTEHEKGNELLLYYLEFGDTCAMTLNCCSKATKSTIRAITEEDSEIVFIPVVKMEEWMVKYSSWRNFVLESYHTRLNEMLEAIDNLAFNDMDRRLYKYLQNKVIVSKNRKLSITQAQIANDLNSSRVVISRLLKKLQLEGKIEYERNQIEVFDYME